MEALAGALLIFFMRVIDMSLDTVRLIMTVRGRKLLAGGIGVAQALVFILAVSAVLKGPLTVGNVLGYSLGFGAGVMLGIYFEERLAIGHSMFRIYSPAYGHEIAEALRGGRPRRHRVPRHRPRRHAGRGQLRCQPAKRIAGARGDRRGRCWVVRDGGRSASDAARLLQALAARNGAPCNQTTRAHVLPLSHTFILIAVRRDSFDIGRTHP